jgi:Transposase DDE domain
MDFAAFEHDPKFVIEALRRGEIDYLENLSEAAEADFFRHLIGRDALKRLAESYPTPRKKEEVPVWLYIASQISLKLHDASYHAFPYVLRSGGLIAALGPEIGRKAVHPDTQDVTLACEGFNDKNTHDRQTPCDQDFLRKFARDTSAERLHSWFNREVPRLLRSLKLFDSEGLFLGDASYIFVPDNEKYEGSVKLLFDEHNHPVDSKQVDLRDPRYQWRRCYKLVSIIHVNRNLNLFLTVAARVVPGNQHECPILYELVDGFVKAVSHGWMKVLIVDRGLIDGAQIARLKTACKIDTVVPLKKNMNAYQDVMGLTRFEDFAWEPYQTPLATQPPPTHRPKHPAIIKRELKRQQTLAAKKGLPPPQSLPQPPLQPSPPPPPPPQPRTLLGLARGVTSWTECTVPLTVVASREIDTGGEVHDWVLATTSATFSAAHTRSTYALRTAIEERHRQYKCFWDVARMPSCKFSMVVTQVLFVLLAYTLLQAHLVLRHRQELNPRTRQRLLQLLNPALEVVAVYYQQRFCLLSLVEFAVILLELDETSRAKLLPKMKQIKRDVYQLLRNARPP